MAKIDVNTGVELPRRFLENAVGNALRRIRDRSRTGIQKRLSLVMQDFIRRNPVWQSIKGREISGRSLQAELGMTSEFAELLAQEIATRFSDTTNIRFAFPRNQAGGIDIVITSGLSWGDISKKFQSALASPMFSYTSSPSGATIPVLRIILYSPGSVVGEIDGIENYNIAREGNPSASSSKLLASRSGKAYMRKSRFPYQFPPIAVPRLGRNFLDDILQNPNFIRRIETEMRNEVLRQIRSELLR